MVYLNSIELPSAMAENTLRIVFKPERPFGIKIHDYETQENLVYIWSNVNSCGHTINENRFVNYYCKSAYLFTKNLYNGSIVSSESALQRLEIVISGTVIVLGNFLGRKLVIPGLVKDDRNYNATLLTVQKSEDICRLI